MKKLHISGKRKALGALLASLIIGSCTAALAEEAGDLSVFDENDAELSIFDSRYILLHLLLSDFQICFQVSLVLHFAF